MPFFLVAHSSSARVQTYSPAMSASMRTPCMLPQRQLVRGPCTVSRVALVVPSPRCQQLSSLRCQAKKEAQQAEPQVAPVDSEEEATSTSEGESSEGELDTCQKLVLALKARDYKDAEILADAVVAEVGALAAIVESAELDTKATRIALDNQKDQYKRLQADFQNFRNRSANEAKNSSVAIKTSLIEELLPVIDGFDSASAQVKTTTPGEEKINGSYQGLYKQMVNIFKDMGLEAVGTEGCEFDPEVHDAIMREESVAVPDGFVLQEFRKGFKFQEKLVRPAMVSVASAPVEAPVKEEAAEAEETSDAK